MSGTHENKCAASIILVRELNEELQSKLHHLTVSHHKCEKLLRYLTLCQSDNGIVERSRQQQLLGGEVSPYVEASTETKLFIDEPIVCLSSGGLDPVSFSRSNVKSSNSPRTEIQTTIGSSSLEDVLCMAREIREKKSGRKVTHLDSSTEKDILVKVSSGKTNSSKVKTFGLASKCGAANDSKKISRNVSKKGVTSKKVDLEMRPLADKDIDFVGDTRESVDVGIREHLLAQLNTLLRHKRSICHQPMHGMCKDLYLSQAQYLRKLNSRRTFPRSIAYSALKFEKGKLVKERVNDSYSQQTERMINGVEDITNTLRYLEVLASTLSDSKEHYNKYVKNKLLRIPIQKMDKDDIKNIFKSWYETQKYLDAYTNITDKDVKEEIDSKSAEVHDAEVKKLEDMKLLLIDSLPVTQLSHLMGITDDTIMSHDWLKTSIRNIDEYHDEYDVRVRYLTETSIGRNELKTAIQRLKKCCASESGINRNNQCHDVYAWIEALKYYRGVHTCLTAFAQNGLSCMFIPSNPS